MIDITRDWLCIPISTKLRTVRIDRVEEQVMQKPHVSRIFDIQVV